MPQALHSVGLAYEHVPAPSLALRVVDSSVRKVTRLKIHEVLAEPPVEQQNSGEIDDDTAPYHNAKLLRGVKQMELDCLEMYIAKMCSIPLLSVEEERTLTTEIVRLREEKIRLQQAGKTVPLSSDTPKEHKPELSVVEQTAINRWLAAKEQLVDANLRLSFSIAKKYRNRGLDFQDLIQLGNMGLIIAAEKFDPSLGNKFSTYATWWIMHQIRRGLHDQSRTVRLPAHRVKVLNQILSFRNEFMEQHAGRSPSHQDIGSALNLDPHLIREILGAHHGGRAIDAPLEEDGLSRSTLYEQKEPRPRHAERISQQEAIIAALRSLEERERQLISLQFGLGLEERRPLPGEEDRVYFDFDPEAYGKSYSHKEIAEKVGLTRQRVQQIIERAIKKLEQTGNPLRFGIAVHAHELHEEVSRTQAEKLGKENEKPKRPSAVMDPSPSAMIGLAELNLPQRFLSALEAEQIYTLQDYRNMSDEERVSVCNMGAASFREIDQILQKRLKRIKSRKKRRKYAV